MEPADPLDGEWAVYTKDTGPIVRIATLIGTSRSPIRGVNRDGAQLPMAPLLHPEKKPH